MRLRLRGQHEKEFGFALRGEFFERAEATSDSLVFIAVFAGNIILWHFVRANFAFVGVVSVLHALHDFGFEGVSFLEQFVHALRIRSFAAGQSLQIPRLPARSC